MTVVYPEGTPTLGNTKVQGVVTIADATAPKLATEIKAATSVEISCALLAAGWSPEASTAKGERARRLCSKKGQETLNTTTYTLGALQYVHDPQADDSAVGNEAREVLVEGTKIHLLERQGLDAEEVDWAVSQHTVDHYVELGPQIRSGDRTDENGEFFITQELVYVKDGPVYGVIVA